MSVNTKMTAIADEIRVLSGTTDPMGLDAMATNVGNANTEVDSQAEIMAQIRSALEGKSVEGGGATSNMANVQLITTEDTKLIAYSGSDGVKCIETNFPSEINCYVPSILVTETLTNGMGTHIYGDIERLKSVSQDDSSSSYDRLLDIYIVSGDCRMIFYPTGES